jgi:hypothetical protein
VAWLDQSVSRKGCTLRGDRSRRHAKERIQVKPGREAAGEYGTWAVALIRATAVHGVRNMRRDLREALEVS